VLRAPFRHRALALACFSGVFVLSVIALLVLPFRYEVGATLLAQRAPIMSSLSNPGMNRDWDLPTRAAREVVLRRDNLVSLAQQTNFAQRYLETRAPAVRAWHAVRRLLGSRPLVGDDLVDALVDSLEDRLHVGVNPQQGTVNISFQWSDPDLTYQMVVAAVQSFLEARHASETTAIAETIAVLQSHEQRLRNEITATTRSLEEQERALRGRTGVPRVALRPAARSDDVAALENQLAARRLALADLEEFRRRRVAELQAQLAQQLTTYAPQHPAVIATRQSIETSSGTSPQLATMRAEVAQLEAEVRRRGGRVDATRSDALALEAQIAESRIRLAGGDPRLEVERSQLDLLLRQHSNLLERIDAARVEMDTAQAAFKYRYIVTSPPQMPAGPIKPKPLFIIVGGVLGGIAFLLFACAFVDVWEGRAIEPWQLERALGVDVIGDLRR
jgi:uncharacterized protein involved in exopolysaccharide biosynthesis